jgi:hypothetical protein
MTPPPSLPPHPPSRPVRPPDLPEEYYELTAEDLAALAAHKAERAKVRGACRRGGVGHTCRGALYMFSGTSNMTIGQ